MSSVLKKSLFVLIAFMIVGMMTSCGAAKKPKPEHVDLDELEHPGLKILREAQPIVGEPWWKLREEGYQNLGHIIIDMQLRLDSFEADEDYYERKLELKEDYYEAKLDEWYRKWYLTIPLGVLVGFISYLTVDIATD